MICPKCTFEQPDDSTQCLRCGVIFAKLHPAQSCLETDHADFPSEEQFIGNGRLTGTITDVTSEENPIHLAGRAIVWVLLLVWGVKFIFTPVSGEAFFASFMHLVNLPFHEAGHVIFSPFGRFIQVLGGTLGVWLRGIVDGCGACLGWVGTEPPVSGTAAFACMNLKDSCPQINAD